MFGPIVARWFPRRTSNTARPIQRTILPLLLMLALLAGGLGRPVAAQPFGNDPAPNAAQPFRLFLPSVVGGRGQQADLSSRVLPQLQREAALQPDKMFRVIVTTMNDNLDGEVVVDPQTGNYGGRKLKDMPNNAFVAEVPGSEMYALGSDPNVKFVAPDAVVVSTCQGCAAVSSANLANQYVNAIQAAGLWPTTPNGTGWTGKGIGVAVLDTGVNPNRNDWNDAQGNSRIIADAHFSPAPERRADGHGHGTHVAGIIAGNSWHRTETALKGKYIGVAPEANIIDVKVSDDYGRSFISDVVYGIDWVIAHREQYNIRVMNLSLVSSVAESYKTSTLAAAVERAWFNGIFVVVASGNAGPNTLRYPPANDPFVVTVGASDTMNTVAQADDTIAPWSSYGLTQDGFSKPDVVAPGRYIISPLTSQISVLGLSMSSRWVENGKYIWLSGTSMAAPVVAGVAALAFQAHPEWTNDHVKSLLLTTSTRLNPTTVPLLTQGAGEVNATAVVNFPATPPLANQGLRASEQLIGPGGAILYNSSSWSSSSWSSSSWSSSSWSSSSWSSSSWSSSNYAASGDCTIDGECTEVASTDVE